MTDPQAVLTAYIEGTRIGDADGLRALFHPAAVIFGWRDGAVRAGSPQPFFDAVATGPAGPDYAAEVIALDQDERIATATLVERSLWGMEFTNHFQLMRQPDGAWRITAKLFHGA